MGAAGGIGTCSTRSGRSRRSDRMVGSVASAGAEPGLASVAARPVQAHAGTGAQGADATLLPGVSSRRSRSVRPDCRPLTSHMPHTPLTRIALFVQVACCGVSPPAALRPARAGTRRAARPRPRPCTQPPPSPQRAIPLPALTLPAPALCRPCVSPRAHEATLLFPRPSLLFLCRCSLP